MTKRRFNVGDEVTVSGIVRMVDADGGGTITIELGTGLRVTLREESAALELVKRAPVPASAPKERAMIDDTFIELVWIPSWPDRQFDFSASDAGKRVGRVYRTMGGSDEDLWQWHMFACIGIRHAAENGSARSRDQAMRLVEQRYRAFRALLGSRHQTSDSRRDDGG